MIKKITKKFAPRAPKAKLKYSYRPRLRPIMSADSKARRREHNGSGILAGIGRKIILLAIIGTVGFMLYEHGIFKIIKGKAATCFAGLKIPDKAEAKASKSALKQNIKGATTSPDSQAFKHGLLQQARSFIKNRFIKPPVPETPVAFIRLKELYGIGASGAVLGIKDSVFYDMPLISGTFEEDKVPGDTIKEAMLAVSIITQAEKFAPGLLKRTSEIIVKSQSEAEALFSDSRLTALLGPRNIKKQLSNLSVFIDKWAKDKKALINMAYGDIAFIQEEEANE